MSPLRPIRAALIGLLGVATALAAGHLVAGALTAPAASPFLAVGNAAIDRTPQPVKEFAIRQFPADDHAHPRGDTRRHDRRFGTRSRPRRAARSRTTITGGRGAAPG